jgi:hypothetical protein
VLGREIEQERSLTALGATELSERQESAEHKSEPPDEAGGNSSTN